MNKKIRVLLIIFILLIITSVVSGCGDPFKIKTKNQLDLSIITENMATIVETEETLLNWAINEDTVIQGVLEDGTISINLLSPARFSLYRTSVYNEDTQTTTYGLYSLRENKTVFAAIYNSISIQSKSVSDADETFYLYYVRVRKSTDTGYQYGLFTLTGTPIAPLASYDDYPNLNLEVVSYYNTDNEVETKESYETLTITTLTNAVETVTVNYYKVNEDRSRTSITLIPEDPNEDEDIGAIVGEQVTTELLDATNYGLKDCYYSVEKINNRDFYSFYNEQKALMSTINIPSTAQFQTYVGGKLIYQTIQIVPEESRNYTLAYQGNKALLKTYSIDLRTGEIEEHKFNYYLTTVVKKIINSDEVAQYVVANVYAINNKLMDEDYITMIIDGNLNFVSNVNSKNMSFTDLIKLDTNRFLLINNQDISIVDATLTVVSNLKGYTHKINWEENSITLKNTSTNRYGVIDYDGKVLIPFVYSTELNFYNGYAYAHNVVEECYVCVNSSNEIIRTPKYVEVSNNDKYYVYFRSDLLYSCEQENIGLEDNYTTIYTYKFYTYSGNLLLTYSLVDQFLPSLVLIYDTYNISTTLSYMVVNNTIKDITAFNQSTGENQFEYENKYYIFYSASE